MSERTADNFDSFLLWFDIIELCDIINILNLLLRLLVMVV